MKTFKEYVIEQTKSLGDNPKFKEMRQRDQDFYRQTFKSEPPTSLNDTRPVDLTGSRHGDGIVSDQDKSARQIQKQLRKDYQQPPGFGTSAFEKARERMAAADTVGNEPPMPGAGPYKTRYTDPMKTAPVVPVSSVKPPIPKLRPERKPVITNKDNIKGAVAIPEPKSIGFNVKPSKKASQKNQTFAQAFKNAPEGSKFKWTDPKTGKTGTYLRKTKKG